MTTKSKRSVQDVVGKQTYSVWVNMLRELANQIPNRNEDEHSTAMSIIDAAEAGNPDDIKELIHDIIHQLFMDAGVGYERVSKRGEHYSVVDETYNEFASWFDYPWD